MLGLRKNEHLQCLRTYFSVLGGKGRGLAPISGDTLTLSSRRLRFPLHLLPRLVSAATERLEVSESGHSGSVLLMSNGAPRYPYLWQAHVP
jgi:hypothetical protein